MTTPTVRAVDLPVGSVVATARSAWIKHPNLWERTNGAFYADRDLDSVLAEGAEVLRVGTGGQS